MSRADVLVSADWAEENLDTPAWSSSRSTRTPRAYDSGHIAGAVKLDWKTDLQDPVRRDFVDKARFEKLLSAKGIGNDDTVVLYGGNNNWFAAYAYWYFKLYGHEDVKLLDGGRKKWELDGRPLTEDADRAPGHPVHRARTRTPRSARSATRSSPRSAARTWSTSARPTSSPASCSRRRTCRRSSPSGPGHIPTALNVPWSKAANEDGTFKSDDELRDALRARPGWTARKDTIAYCRIGERSSHTWFVLHELLGEPNVKNYDGSWTEYGSLVGVPIEKDADHVRRTRAGEPSTARCRRTSTWRRRRSSRAGWSADGEPVAGRVRPAARRDRRVHRRGGRRARPASSGSSPRPGRGRSGRSPRARAGRPTSRPGSASPRRASRSASQLSRTPSRR